MIEEPPRGVFLVGEERAVEQRCFEDRYLQPPEQAAQRLRNRRIAEDVIEQKRDHVDGDLVRRIGDLVGDCGADPRNWVEGHHGRFGASRTRGCRGFGRSDDPRIQKLPAVERRDDRG